MRRFAGTQLQCRIFLPCSDLFWASVSRFDIANQATHSSRPSTRRQVRPFVPRTVLRGAVVCRSGRYCVFAIRMLLQITRLASQSCTPLTPLVFIGRESRRRCVPVTPPIALKLQGLAAKKACRLPARTIVDLVLDPILGPSVLCAVWRTRLGAHALNLW